MQGDTVRAVSRYSACVIGDRNVPARVMLDGIVALKYPLDCLPAVAVGLEFY